MYFNRVLSFCSIILFFCLIYAAIAKASSEYRIGLQNQNSRAIVYCYDNPKHSAEECATYYETIGFTKIKDLPTKSARYDFLTVDTFPTRRWRNGEITPRW